MVIPHNNYIVKFGRLLVLFPSLFRWLSFQKSVSGLSIFFAILVTHKIGQRAHIENILESA